MALFERYKFHYQTDFTDQIPYEGRVYQATLYQKDGPLARLTLNRPEKRNALNDAMFADLMAGLHQARRDPEVRVVIIRGAGLSFSAGHDLSSPPGEETPPIPPHLAPTVRDYYNVERRRCGKYEDLRRYPKITIAQVQGYCIGAGEAIASNCDFVIAAEDAVFGTPGFGTFYGHAYFPLWPYGSPKAQGGQVLPGVSAPAAAEMGMINKVVPADRLEEEVNRWAEALCRLPTDALMGAKEWINGTVDLMGVGVAWRGHFDEHIAIQWIRFGPDEVSFYKVRRDKGLRGFIEHRAVQATTAGSGG